MIKSISDLKIKLFYIAALISLAGHSIDAFFIEPVELIIKLNYLTLILVIIIGILFLWRKIPINLANSFIVYSAMLNAILSIVLYPNIIESTANYFELAMLYGILILYAGFALRRIHIYIIGVIYLLMYISYTFYTNNEDLMASLPMVVILLICYMLAMNYIVYLINSFQNEQDILIENLKETNILLKEKGDELNKLNSTKDKLLSIIGHDLQTPANTIMGFSQLISRAVENADNRILVDYSNYIYQSANRLSSLLNQLLDWARLQTGKIKINLKPADVNKIIKESVDLMHGTIYLKKINVEVADPIDKKLRVDKHMLSAIIRNLLTNALKFTQAGGTIRIKTNLNSNRFKFTISDSGVGMSEETLLNLFGEKLIESRPGTENEKGTGLGLIVCKEYIKLHKGKIWAESELGNGSKFFFEIPVAR